MASNSQKTVLIVDDSKTQLGFYRIQCTKAGYNVVTAESVQDAFIKIFEYQPDIALVDVIMPDVSGFQLCKIIKNNIVLKHIPVILFTSLQEIDTYYFWAKKASADYFTTKNTDFSNILVEMEKLLSDRPVPESVKKLIEVNKSKATTVFNECNIISDVEWMDSTIFNEFKKLTCYFQNVPILISKLFGMLSSILPYDLCLFSFNQTDISKKIEIYQNTNGIIVDKELVEDLSSKFLEDNFGAEKKILQQIFETGSKNKKVATSFSSIKNIKFYSGDAVIGAVCFYGTAEYNIENISYYHEIINSIEQLVKGKLYIGNTSFLAYNAPEVAIYNKMQLVETLNIEFARTKISQIPVSLVVMTFASYSMVEAKYGAEIANRITEQSIHLITTALRAADKVYRYDYSTIIIVMGNSNCSQAKVPVKRITQLLNDTKYNLSDIEFSFDIISTLRDNSISSDCAEDFFKKTIELHQRKLIENRNII